VVARYDPSRALRTFLKATLRNFLSNVGATARLRSGRGGRGPLARGRSAGPRLLRVDARAEDPDALFDRQWVREVLSQSVEKLRAPPGGGQGGLLQGLRGAGLCPADRERPSYEETARALGIKADDVRNHLHHVRARLQQIIVRTISEYAASPQDVEEELRDLFRR